MKPAQHTRLIGTLACLISCAGCGGSNSPPQDPSTTAGSTAHAGDATGDPASGTSDLNSASNSSTAPPGAPESLADPSGHAPVVSTGSSSGDTPINSGAGDAAPEHKH